MIQENSEKLPQQGSLSDQAVDPNSAKLTGAKEALKQKLLKAVMQQAMAEIGDADSIAHHVMNGFRSQMPEVPAASTRLRELLLAEIARRSRQELVDADAVAEDVLPQIEFQSPEMLRVKEALKVKILNQVMTSAIQEITSEVGTGSGDLDHGLLEQIATETITTGVDTVAQAPTEKAGAEGSNRFGSEAQSALESDSSASFGDSTESWTDQDERLYRSEVPDHDPGSEMDDEDVSYASTSEAPSAEHDEEDTAELESFLSHGNDGAGMPDVSATGEVPPVTALDEEPDLEDEAEARHSWRTLDSYDAAVISDATEELELDDHRGRGETDDAHSEVSATLPTTEEVDSSTVYYVYGIMTSAGDGFHGPLPLGIQSGRVETVDYDGLSAVVSVVPKDVFYGEALKENLRDAAWLQENVRKHASIVEQLRSRQTLLPMPFCSIYPDRAGVVGILEKNYDQHFDNLDRVEGKQEWGLRIYRNRSVLESRVSDSDRRVEGALGTISRGVSGYLRNEMDRMEQENRHDPIELVTEHCTQRSHEAILGRSSEGRQNPDRGGQERPGESMVLNRAYLVDAEIDSEIRAEVERLRAEYAEMGFRFELSGPWPPYHFVGTGSDRLGTARSIHEDQKVRAVGQKS